MAASSRAFVLTRASSAICLASPSSALPRRVALKKDLSKRQPVLGAEPFGIGRQIGRELFFARLRGSHVLDEKFHLLPHTAANDEVVAVEPRRLSFAVENLVADLILDEAVQLLLASAAAARCARTRRQGWLRAMPKR